MRIAATLAILGLQAIGATFLESRWSPKPKLPMGNPEVVFPTALKGRLPRIATYSDNDRRRGPTSGGSFRPLICLYDGHWE